MDSYRNPMYNNRYNRNMNPYQNQRRGNYVMPVADTGNCGCKKEMENEIANCVDNLPLAMAYVPMQKWRNVLDGCNGLAKGTIFEELVLPYYGDRNSCGMRGGR